MDKRKTDSSWEGVESWYDKSVGKSGHYYHEKIVLPGVVRLLELEKTSPPKLLDLGCGQGVLARQIPQKVDYVGIDLSSSLIKAAKQYGQKNHQNFFVGDATKPLPVKEKDFSHATLILSLQNMERPQDALKNAASHLIDRGVLVIVLNHPCFRIPRQSSWGIDEQKKIQYRRLDRYLSSLKVPIQMHPGQKESSKETWSFHHALSTYSTYLKEAGFVIDLIEEWCSDKKSVGGAARMENFSRKEFPLFMAIRALRLKN